VAVAVAVLELHLAVAVAQFYGASTLLRLELLTLSQSVAVVQVAHTAQTIREHRAAQAQLRPGLHLLPSQVAVAVARFQHALAVFLLVVVATVEMAQT
jgi:hypothetical protein